MNIRINGVPATPELPPAADVFLCPVCDLELVHGEAHQEFVDAFCMYCDRVWDIDQVYR